jgi:hypothetical protein
VFGWPPVTPGHRGAGVNRRRFLRCVDGALIPQRIHI